ncbi:phospholipase [Rhodopirellula sp. JC740]|uniref:Phospholipase n=1 Tax=Rhodopirellula halodulae TaxID=2894198 RepID=A0ABS8NCV3_9BACT|nr:MULTISPECIES: C4-type zinc ribbon domain-containing protein [unclassified Rhodopirellula]MCC9641378.1 phospholipase [Rhodopirellula sp. JC740]MCC9657786.1 phospholipase [Rhodopirellula sp. JC737]
MASSTIKFNGPLLRTLHNLLQQRTDLEGQLRRGPIQIKAVQAIVDEAQANVAAAEETLKKTRMTADEKQLQLQSREAHVKNLQGKLNTAASNKEFALLKDQIAADEQANSVQSDEILEVLERIDSCEIDVTVAKQQLTKAEQDQAKRVEQIESRLEQVRADLDRITEQLKQQEGDIPAAARADYRRLVDARGDEALAPIEQDSCGGCYQTLTTQVMSQVMLSTLTHCPNCNAILYQA